MRTLNERVLDLFPLRAGMRVRVPGGGWIHIHDDNQARYLSRPGKVEEVDASDPATLGCLTGITRLRSGCPSLSYSSMGSKVFAWHVSVAACDLVRAHPLGITRLGHFPSEGEALVAVMLLCIGQVIP